MVFFEAHQINGTETKKESVQGNNRPQSVLEKDLRDDKIVVSARRLQDSTISESQEKTRSQVHSEQIVE